MAEKELEENATAALNEACKSKAMVTGIVLVSVLAVIGAITVSKWIINFISILL